MITFSLVAQFLQFVWIHNSKKFTTGIHFYSQCADKGRIAVKVAGPGFWEMRHRGPEVLMGASSPEICCRSFSLQIDLKLSTQLNQMLYDFEIASIFKNLLRELYLFNNLGKPSKKKVWYLSNTLTPPPYYEVISVYQGQGTLVLVTSFR